MDDILALQNVNGIASLVQKTKTETGLNVGEEKGQGFDY